MHKRRGKKYGGHGRKRRNHRNRNCGSTSVCTTTTFFFFFLTARPIRIPVGLQEMMPCVNKKKEGGGGGRVNKVRFGTFGNSSERFFNRMLWSEKKVHTRDCRHSSAEGSWQKWRVQVFLFKGMTIQGKKRRRKKLEGKSPPQCN